MTDIFSTASQAEREKILQDIIRTSGQYFFCQHQPPSGATIRKEVCVHRQTIARGPWFLQGKDNLLYEVVSLERCLRCDQGESIANELGVDLPPRPRMKNEVCESQGDNMRKFWSRRSNKVNSEWDARARRLKFKDEADMMHRLYGAIGPTCMAAILETSVHTIIRRARQCGVEIEKPNGYKADEQEGQESKPPGKPVCPKCGTDMASGGKDGAIWILRCPCQLVDK